MSNRVTAELQQLRAAHQQLQQAQQQLQSVASGRNEFEALEGAC